MIKKVSQLWFHINELTIKLVVSLVDYVGKDSFYSIYRQEDWEYVTINQFAKIEFQYKDTTLWDNSKTIHISDNNIVRLNRGIRQIQTCLSNPDLFRYHKRDGSIEYCGTKEDKVNISLGKGEFLELEPGVLFVDSNTCIPGVLFRINKKRNEVGVSIDEFEAIAYKLLRTNIGLEGQQLLITKLLMEERIRNVMMDAPKEKPKASIFAKKDPKEYVEGELRPRVKKEDKPQSLEDLL